MTTGLFVLGAGRSGTSALTASLGMMGAHLGDHLLPGRDDNKKGFFEDVRCVSLNVKILQAFHTTGYGGVALPTDWRTTPSIAKGTRRARAILADLGRKPVYAIKDPRLSLLGDMWFTAAQELGHDIRCIIALRHPLQVARSLEKRQRLLRYASYLMWILYNIEAVSQSAPYARCFVSFEDLQSDPKATLSRVADLVGIEEHFRLDDERLRRITDFIDPSLVSSREDVDQQYKQIGGEVASLYQALRKGQIKKFSHLMNKGHLRTFTEVSKFYQHYTTRLCNHLVSSPDTAQKSSRDCVSVDTSAGETLLGEEPVNPPVNAAISERSALSRRRQERPQRIADRSVHVDEDGQKVGRPPS